MVILNIIFLKIWIIWKIYDFLNASNFKNYEIIVIQKVVQVAQVLSEKLMVYEWQSFQVANPLENFMGKKVC